MIIRRAVAQDLPGLAKLLLQVCSVHADGRPDLFIHNARKYTDEELLGILADNNRPVFVAAAKDAPSGDILGYCFCVHKETKGKPNMPDHTTLYIDDLCVDESARGRHVGSALYTHVLDYARERGFYNITLNVWTLNAGAESFYRKMGLSPLKTCMEQVL